MMPAIVSSLIYINARGVMELFPPKLRNVWKDWELRVLVLLSLMLQIVLIVFGNRRKCTRRTWIRVVLWCVYLMADWVATVALGVISNNLGDTTKSIGKDGSLIEGIHLTAFWAPFLLLHLGGPDNITAYAMEDNELWLRHLVGFGVQTGVAVYIFLTAWKSSELSILSIPMFCVGMIKYGERTWVLRSASNEQFRECVLTPPDPGPNYPKFMREYTSKQIEGFHVIANEVIEAQVVNLPSSDENNPIRDATELVTAYDLFKTFRCLFVDLILGYDDRDNSQSLFKKTSFDKAFKVIEIELGFMYDVLFTKATIIHSPQGWALRLISFSFTCIVLAIFSITDKHKYSKIDVALTFLLLYVAILLEIYAFLLLLSSDWTDLWLSKGTTNFSQQVITLLQFTKKPRWSNSMAQFNLLSFTLKEKNTIFCRIQKLLCIDKVLEKYQYTTFEDVPMELKKFMYNYLKEMSNDANNIRILCSVRGGEALKKYGHNKLIWSVQGEFEQSILIWHIATDLCFNLDYSIPLTCTSICYWSRLISQYMLYLLVMCPFMLPMGIGMIRFRDTCAEVIKFFEEHQSMAGSVKSNNDGFRNTCSQGRGCLLDKLHLCEILLHVNTQIPPAKVKGDRSKSVLFDACRLASELQAISNKNQKWEIISSVWVEMLAYAACHCRGNYHAQQLRRGGELLTHVWLLMAHFGLTELFQISEGHARAKLVLK